MPASIPTIRVTRSRKRALSLMSSDPSGTWYLIGPYGSGALVVHFSTGRANLRSERAGPPVRFESPIVWQA